jgi:hypothetical protein
MAAPSHVLPFLSPAGTASSVRASPGRRPCLLRCAAAAGQAGFFTRLGRLIREKAKSDVEKLFSGFSKTRENLSVVDELLTYWNLADTDRVLDELEEVTAPPRTACFHDSSAPSFFILMLLTGTLLLLLLAGTARLGLRAQNLVPDRRHAPRGNPRRQAQVRRRDKGQLSLSNGILFPV